MTTMTFAADLITPSRSLNEIYIVFDIVCLAALAVLLLVSKRRMTFLFGLAGGVIYLLVDYGIFYKLLGTRELFYKGAEMSEPGKFWFLTWLSMSYGFTNFVWIWLWLKKDKRALEFTVFIVLSWIVVPTLAQNFGSSMDTIQIQRGTGSYHGIMGLILILSYGAVIVYNVMFAKEKSKRINILFLMAVGISVQLGWEACLLLSGIRPLNAGTWFTLISNALIETNLGIPAIFVIQSFALKKFGEDLLTRDRQAAVITAGETQDDESPELEAGNEI